MAYYDWYYWAGFGATIILGLWSLTLPKLKVDTKVLVWENGYKEKRRRHFSHFDEYGTIHCFINGTTSWTTDMTNEWDNWELAED